MLRFLRNSGDRNSRIHESDHSDLAKLDKKTRPDPNPNKLSPKDEVEVYIYIYMGL